MRKIFTFFVAVFITATIWAQSPDKMSYQAVIRNSSEALVTNTQIGMQISILQGSASGTAVYVETQEPTTNANGLVSVEIGAGTAVSGNFANIDWANGPYFIKTETDPTGGISYTITGTSQLLSVPYALHAKSAEKITGGISENDPVFGAWDKSSGISVTESQISDLQNYLTSEVDGSVTNELQVLSIINDTIYLSNGGFVKLPAAVAESDPVFNAWDKDYNDLTNQPTIPTVPTKVSQFTNDAGYMTSEVDGSVTNELQALSISNDTIYLSNGGFVKLPAAAAETDPMFNAWNKDYNDLANQPTIPTVPNNVSVFINDAGYMTSEVDGSVTNELQALSIRNDTIYLSNGGFVKLPAAAAETDPMFNAWDKDYNDLTNQPAIPIVPTYVSEFTNDAGYLNSEVDGSVTNELQALIISHDTIYLSNGGFVKLPAPTAESDPVFNAWDKDYNDLTNQPTIPTVPNNVSEFTNDAGYLTNEVDGSVTNELQALRISKDTIYLSNGGFVKLPAATAETDPVFNAWDKDYNDLTNQPTIPTVPTNLSEFTNDAGYLTNEVDGSVTNELQALSISNDTIYLSNGGFVKLPAAAAETDPVFRKWDKDYNDLTNTPASADGSETKLTAGTNVTVTGSGTTANPYVVNATGIPPLAIGQSYQGGIIFWLDATGQHGLIAATVDQSTRIFWYNNGIIRFTGATGDGLYAGAMNTTLIVATQIADDEYGNFAAKVCANYSVTVDGVTYGDWYLPSKYELNLLCTHRTAVGGFTNEFYLSSTESERFPHSAWGQLFYDGEQSELNKIFPFYVRAIRAF